MNLPVLPFKIPEVPIPFDIPVLMHPVVAHFAIALPVIVLLLEIINLITKKRAIGVVSFFLLSLTVAVLIVAYLTGLADGKEAFDFLSQTAQAELKAHKLLGIYLILGSSAVLLFKLLSAMISRGMMKGLYLLILILFVVGILKQGKDGGELVYLHGANVERVKSLDNEMFDLKEELEELKEKSKKVVVKAVKAVKETVEDSTQKAEKVIEEAVDTKIEEASEVISEVKSELISESTKIETPSDTNAS